MSKIGLYRAGILSIAPGNLCVRERNCCMEEILCWEPWGGDGLRALEVRQKESTHLMVPRGVQFILSDTSFQETGIKKAVVRRSRQQEEQSL